MAHQLVEAMVKARGFDLSRVEVKPLGRSFVAVIVKDGGARAEALGSNPNDAIDKLVRVLVRP